MNYLKYKLDIFLGSYDYNVQLIQQTRSLCGTEPLSPSVLVPRSSPMQFMSSHPTSLRSDIIGILRTCDTVNSQNYTQFYAIP
jgi:hypothetical protein